MNINEIVKNIPNAVAKYFKHIYIVSKSKNEFYSIDYSGAKTKVEPKKEYKEIENVLSNYSKPCSSIVNTKKGIYTSDKHGDDLILMDDLGDYRVLYVINLIPKKENKRFKIIVADDSTIITKFLYKLFKDQYDVLVAHNGKDAISLIEGNDLKDIAGCFIDLNMPISTGYDVLDYFKKNNLFKTIPVSIISGEDDVDTISKITIEYDVVDMLRKPFDQTAARDLVTKTINFNK